MLVCKVQRAIGPWADRERCGAIACLVLAHGRDVACSYERSGARRACPSSVGVALIRVVLGPPPRDPSSLGSIGACACAHVSAHHCWPYPKLAEGHAAQVAIFGHVQNQLRACGPKLSFLATVETSCGQYGPNCLPKTCLWQLPTVWHFHVFGVPFDPGF